MLDTHIQNLIDVTKVQAVLICTSEGQIFKQYGQLSSIDTESLGVLIASHVSASSGISQLLHQSQLFDVSLEGNTNIHMSSLNKKFIIVTFSDKKTYKGLIKFELDQIRHAILKELEKESENKILSRHTQELLFEEIQDKEIDRLFENL